MAKRKGGGTDAHSDDQVGDGRPPRGRPFEPGHSGNPWGCKGKPKPELDFMDERQRLRIEGRWRWLTRSQVIDHALYKAVVNDGNVSAAKQLDSRRQARLARRAEGAGANNPVPEDDPALLRAAERFVRKSKADDPGTAEGGETFAGDGEDLDDDPEPEDDH